jgi:hypothetical protein
MRRETASGLLWMALTSQQLVAQETDGGVVFRGQQEVQVQAQEVAKKGEMADAVLAARQKASGRDFGPKVRASLKRSLVSLTHARLEAFLNAGGLGDIEEAAREQGVTSAVGDAGADLVYTPVAPCRILDTRLGAGGRFAAGAVRNYWVRKDGFGFAQQGGATDCGIPTGATAVEMNFIAVTPDGPGDLRATPFSSGGGPFPLASVLNYSQVPGLNIANGIAQPICNFATSTCSADLMVLVEGSGTDLVIDVVGYFEKFDRAQVKSFIVTSQTGATTAILAAPGCTNYDGGAVTVDAPVAGTVVVRSNVSLAINHTLGVQDVDNVFVATTNTDCSTPGGPGYAASANVTSQLPTGLYQPQVNIFRTFSVPPGSTTFFLNGQKVAGAGIHDFGSAGLEATFIPN